MIGTFMCPKPCHVQRLLFQSRVLLSLVGVETVLFPAEFCVNNIEYLIFKYE
jgi:hypothetical protein